MRSEQTTTVKRVAQNAPLVGWRFLGLLGFSLIAVLWLGKSTFAADKIIKSHGISSFGELKYPADFPHFDYICLVFVYKFYSLWCIFCICYYAISH